MSYGLLTPEETVIQVVTLVAYGYFQSAIFKAFGFDECTVVDWKKRAGNHAEIFHQR